MTTTTTERYLTEMFAYLAFDEDHELHAMTDEILARYGISDDVEVLDDELLAMAAGGVAEDLYDDTDMDD